MEDEEKFAGCVVEITYPMDIGEMRKIMECCTELDLIFMRDVLDTEMKERMYERYQ